MLPLAMNESRQQIPLSQDAALVLERLSTVEAAAEPVVENGS